MQRVQTRAVMLEVTHAVEIKRGIVLPRGHTSGQPKYGSASKR